ncbi:hypothetical protein [Rhodophyticola sp.]|uniref:hypothetical protein n=1 Tax=Rhodophyticola sp. TaxID=2680032 RepID=UPI003D2AF786
MRLRPVSRRRVELVISLDPLASYIALYRVVSTVLKARVLAAGGAELHASAVGGHGRIVAFVGPKGAGKTSLCMDFVLSQRAAFVANDHILLLPGDPVGVVSLPETLRIGQGTISQHKVLRSLAARTGRGFGSDGKTRIHVSEIAPLLNDRPVFSGPLAAIVTCAFDNAAQGGVLERVSGPSATVSDALTGMAKHVRPAWIEGLDACAVRRSGVAALSLDRVPTFRLRRAKGDTYAPLRLARSLRSVLDADLTGEPI